MSGRVPLDLERQRDLGELLGTAFRLYWQNLATLLAIGGAVSITVNLIVAGLGLEQLFSDYDPSPSTGETLALFSISLVTNPLIIAMTIAALLELDQGREPSAGAAIQRGLDVFAPLFLVVVIAAAGVAAGLLLLIVPGIYLAIRWYFVTQAVVVEGARGTRALSRSGELVRGSWWRVLGIVLVTGLIMAAPALTIGLPLDLAADSADRAALSLLGTIVSETIIAPFNALVVTLLYFDLRARGRAAQVPAAVSGPPDPPGLPPRP